MDPANAPAWPRRSKRLCDLKNYEELPISSPGLRTTKIREPKAHRVTVQIATDTGQGQEEPVLVSSNCDHLILKPKFEIPARETYGHQVQRCHKPGISLPLFRLLASVLLMLLLGSGLLPFFTFNGRLPEKHGIQSSVIYRYRMTQTDDQAQSLSKYKETTKIYEDVLALIRNREDLQILTEKYERQNDEVRIMRKKVLIQQEISEKLFKKYQELAKSLEDVLRWVQSLKEKLAELQKEQKTYCTPVETETFLQRLLQLIPYPNYL